MIHINKQHYFVRPLTKNRRMGNTSTIIYSALYMHTDDRSKRLCYQSTTADVWSVILRYQSTKMDASYVHICESFNSAPQRLLITRVLYQSTTIAARSARLCYQSTTTTDVRSKRLYYQSTTMDARSRRLCTPFTTHYYQS